MKTSHHDMIPPPVTDKNYISTFQLNWNDIDKYKAK